jgi:cell division protein FtsZ
VNSFNGFGRPVSRMVFEKKEPRSSGGNYIDLGDIMNILGVSDVEITGQSETVIKVIGAGGGGSNAVNRMIECGLENVQFITANTDLQALNKSRALVKLPIGSKLTGGLGAGGRPEVGENAAMEDRDMIENALRGADMVFITTGMGGGTGTGSAPIIAEVAKSLGALTVGVVTMPFDFEGKIKMNIAKEGLAKLRSVVDIIIIIPNQNVYKMVDRHSSMPEMFLKVDDVLRQGIQGISDMITKHGEINIDFADVREFTKGQGGALIGIGIGSGENRAIEAAEAAMSNPMLEESSIKGAHNILVNVAAGKDFSPPEFQDVVNKVTEGADENVQIKAGWVIDEGMNGSVRVTVVATGFGDLAVTKIKSAKSVEEKERKKTDYLFDDEFERLRGGPEGGKQQPFTLRGDDDLEVPTVLRYGGNVSVFENSYKQKHA